MTASPIALELPELWMELKDRTLLKELMETQGISARRLALEAGWKSHTYLQRLLRGEAKNVEPVPAARIAHRLQVPFNLLFVTRVSGDASQNKQPTQRRRAA